MQELHVDPQFGMSPAFPASPESQARSLSKSSRLGLLGDAFLFLDLQEDATAASFLCLLSLKKRKTTGKKGMLQEKNVYDAVLLPPSSPKSIKSQRRTRAKLLLLLKNSFYFPTPSDMNILLEEPESEGTEESYC